MRQCEKPQTPNVDLKKTDLQKLSFRILNFEVSSGRFGIYKTDV